MRFSFARSWSPRSGTLGQILNMLAVTTTVALACGVAYAALYPRDNRQPMSEADTQRYHGAGILMCYTEIGTQERAAAAWLVGAQDLVVMNAHNFVDRQLTPTHPITDCFFRIGEADYQFDVDTLRLGASVDSKALHITDDWALVRLLQPVPDGVAAQPIPDTRDIAAGPVKVVMVSPAGHANTRLPTTLERCEILAIDAPGEGAIRRARHDCNDGYGGSGSGLFREDGRLIAMHSASLDMNARRPLDIEMHYGSALLFEGELVDALRRSVAQRRN